MNNPEHLKTCMGLTKAVSMACTIGGIIFVYKKGASVLGTYIAAGVSVFGATLLIGVFAVELWLRDNYAVAEDEQIS